MCDKCDCTLEIKGAAGPMTGFYHGSIVTYLAGSNMFCLIGLYMGPNNLCCVTLHFLLFFSVSHVTFYKNFTSSGHFL